MQGLDSLTERIRRIPPLALDAALGAALSLLSVLEFHELKPKDFPPSLHKHWSVYLFIGLTGLAVALRRRKLSVAYPLWVLTNIAVILTRSVWSEFSSGFLIEQVMVFSFAEQTPIPFAAALLILELGVDTGAISVFAKGVEWVPQIFNSFMLLGIVWF